MRAVRGERLGLGSRRPNLLSVFRRSRAEPARTMRIRLARRDVGQRAREYRPSSRSEGYVSALVSVSKRGQR
ncbi:hypothetical protein BDU57DRAFT_514114 [Ampelomyces quisqualis]|uniref:Uncharacterized protein n=1 Tax=Ampelomyces quisqualis TaxID=50730 RepID=A0A6A5QQP3_AMPQU|nr:hypothetical protein BDU57DRAFT_514114 [Ampelomyces quisqualis]